MIAPLKGRVFKIEISKVSGSALATEICTGSHNRLLRRQHCSSLCSQSEGHEHVANMTCALGHDFVGFSAHAGPPQYSPPSLCEQSELQCFAPELRRTLLFSNKRRFFEILSHFQGQHRCNPHSKKESDDCAMKTQSSDSFLYSYGVLPDGYRIPLYSYRILQAIDRTKVSMTVIPQRP